MTPRRRKSRRRRRARQREAKQREAKRFAKFKAEWNKVIQAVDASWTVPISEARIWIER